jgi:hypothetical protein
VEIPKPGHERRRKMGVAMTASGCCRSSWGTTTSTACGRSSSTWRLRIWRASEFASPLLVGDATDHASSSWISVIGSRRSRQDPTSTAGPGVHRGRRI